MSLSLRLIGILGVLGVILGACADTPSAEEDTAASGDHRCVGIVNEFADSLQQYIYDVSSMGAAELAERPPADVFTEAASTYSEQVIEAECNERIVGEMLSARTNDLHAEGAVSELVAASIRAALVGLPAPDAGELTVTPADNLATVVAAAPAGTTLLLEAGAFHVDEPLTIPHGLAILGTGMDTTTVTSTADGFALIYVGTDEMTVEGLTLAYAGSAEASVMVIHSGSYRITDTRVTGGVTQEDGSGGVGLILGSDRLGPEGPDTRGSDRLMSVEAVEIVGNQGPGITVMGSDAPEIIDSTVADNGICGICYAGLEGGMLRGSRVTGNEVGIAIGRASRPDISANTIEGNHRLGMAVEQHGGGDVRENVIAANGVLGVVLSTRAELSLTGNEIRDHSEAGVAIGGTSVVALVDNELRDNGVGIWVEQEAKPRLEGNRIAGRGSVGIVYTSSSAGEGIANEIVGHSIGIDVRGYASPYFVRNAITGANQAAFVFRDHASGNFSDNACVRSPTGFLVLDSSRPQLSGNRCAFTDGRGVSLAQPAIVEETAGEDVVLDELLLEELLRQLMPPEEDDDY